MTSMTTLTPAKLGPSQIAVLSVLKQYTSGLTAPTVRDEADLPAGDYGTRRAHAILARLVELGFVVKEDIPAKSVGKYINETTGRAASHRFKVTTEGKKALRSAS